MKTKNRVREFLEDIGYGLGYNEKLLPDFKDLAIIEKYNIPVWEYMGYRNREDFHTHNKPKHIKNIIKEYGMFEKKYWREDK